MNRTARIIFATGVALSVTVPAVADVASAAPSDAAGTNSSDTSVTVRSGDSLAGLAWRHDVSLWSLLRANSMRLTSMIHPGDTVVIPAGASTGSSGRAGAGSSTPASSTAAASTRPSSGASEYVIESGDALSLIARRHGVRLGALLDANGLSLTSLIVPGQRLRIPPATRAVDSTARSTTPVATSAAGRGGSTVEYTVVAGDALSLIAWRHGVSLGALLDANDLRATSLIVPGQRLRVPSAARPVASPSAATPKPANASSIGSMLSYLRAQVGVPYEFFSAGPWSFDCSGLVVAAFRHVGVSVPHQSRALAKLGSGVDWRTGPIAAGDLVFTSATDDPDLITHVGIALDSTRWIQAVGPGRTVTIGSLPSDDKIMAVQRIALP